MKLSRTRHPFGPKHHHRLAAQRQQVIIDFKDARLPERLARKLDVIDYATPVVSVDTYANDGGVRVEIEGSTDFDDVSYQSDNLFTVDLRPYTKEEQEEARRRKFGYTGERLSLLPEH